MSLSHWKSTLVARPDLVVSLAPLIEKARTLNKVLTIFDLETNDFIRKPTFGIIEVGMLHINAKGKIGQAGSLVNPEYRIPKEVIKITGITNEMVHHLPNWGATWREAMEWMAKEHILIGFNSNTFDIPALKSQHARYTNTTLSVHAHWDVRILHQQMHQTQKGKLSDVASLLGLDISEFKGHRAVNDAVLTATILAKMLERDPAIVEKTQKLKTLKIGKSPTSEKKNDSNTTRLDKTLLRAQVEQYYTKKETFEALDLKNIASLLGHLDDTSVHQAISFEISRAIDEGRIHVLQPTDDKKNTLSNPQLQSECTQVWNEKKRLAPVHALLLNHIANVDYMDVRWVLHNTNARPLPLNTHTLTLSPAIR